MPPPGLPLDRSFFARSALEVAPEMLGTRLVSQVGGSLAAGRVVEVEAYPGPEDPASHAAARIGRTERNEPMFGPPGTVYMHLNYGVHWCLNAVVDQEDHPAAVLVRALEPVAGRETIRQRRGHEKLTQGPGRLTQALGLDDRFQGHVLWEPPLQLFSASERLGYAVDTSPRIGISRGQEKPWRFFLEDHPDLSR